MDTEAAGRLLLLLQVANASFPTGAFNHSYGFETWIDSGEIGDAATFEARCSDWLCHGLAGADGALVAHAHRAAGDTDAVVDLDRLAGALKLSREAREASLKTGRALLRAMRDIFEPADLAAFTAAVASGDAEGHHAVVFGAMGRSFRISEAETVLVYLQSAVANLAGVAARLVPLGQVDAQRVIRAAAPALLAATAKACATPLDALGTATAALDIASMQHERLHTRLCMS